MRQKKNIYTTVAKLSGMRGAPLALNSQQYSHVGLFKSTYLSGKFFLLVINVFLHMLVWTLKDLLMVAVLVAALAESSLFWELAVRWSVCWRMPRKEFPVLALAIFL